MIESFLKCEKYISYETPTKSKYLQFLPLFCHLFGPNAITKIRNSLFFYVVRTTVFVDLQIYLPDHLVVLYAHEAP
jgi:hypothetical protein